MDQKLEERVRAEMEMEERERKHNKQCRLYTEKVKYVLHNHIMQVQEQAGQKREHELCRHLVHTNVHIYVHTNVHVHVHVHIL